MIRPVKLQIVYHYNNEITTLISFFLLTYATGF